MNQIRLTSSEWRAFRILLAGCLLGTVAVIPYATQLTGAEFQTRMLPITLLSAVVNYAFFIYVGLLVKRRVPVAGLPYLERQRPFNAVPFLKLSLAWGIASFLIVLLGDFAFRFISPEDFSALSARRPTATQGLLASLYGGINEEVLLRLFLMSLFAWPLQRLGRYGMWIAIGLTALLFGIGHLPALIQALGVESLFAVSPLLIVRTLVLNMMVGIVCGWLYWRHGLETAILTHFTADIGLHVLVPIFTT